MPVSPSLTQKSLTFDQLRAKFNCSTTSIQEYDIGEITNDNNDKEEKQREKWEGIWPNEEKTPQANPTDKTVAEAMTNFVAIRRKLFEQHQEKITAVLVKEIPPPPSSASQIPKDPPQPTKYPKSFCEDSVPSMSSNYLELSKAADQNHEEGTKGVKNMVEKLNKIGHRPFEPSATLANTFKNQQRDVEMAEEVGTDSSEESENGEERAEEEKGERKRSATADQSGGGGAVHANLLEEMRGKAIFKNSSIASEIPAEVGKFRPLPPDKKCSRKGCASDPPPATDWHPRHSSDNGTAQQPKTNSLFSPKNESIETEEEQCLYEEHFGTIPQYSATDEKESKRLRKLHEVALEIYHTQRTYVMKLQQIGLNYPRYLDDCEKRLNKKLLHPKHVIKRIADHFQIILSVHQIFLREFYNKILKWDSRKPDMAEVFQKKADFLKICRLFLTQKQKLVAELKQNLNECHELAEATQTFEQALAQGNSSARHSFSSGSSTFGSSNDLKGISIVLQLDTVHQNVVHYKSLMERYRKCLPDNLAEAKNADEALEKLFAVTNHLNGSLTFEDEEKMLIALHAKLQDIFNVFATGRRLLHTGELKRQTRRKLQSRHLILFSDTLLICQCTTLALVALKAKYIIPIEEVKLNLPENDETECEFIVLTPYKSSTFVAKSKYERDNWVKRIGDAAERAAKQKLAGRGTSDRTLPQEENESFRFYVTHNQSADYDEKQKPRAKSPSEGAPNTTDAGEEFLDSQESPTDQKCVANVNERPDVSPNQHYVHLFSPNTALWVPDYKATKCMNGCGASFGFYRRKHHCRQCGCIICSECEGMAPVGNAHGMFKRSKVCPKCFSDIREAFECGLLPAKMLFPNQSPNASEFCSATFSLDDPSLRIKCEGGVLTHPSKLFAAPANGPMNKDIKLEEEKVVSGKVFLRTHQKCTVPRWASLSAESSLQFFKAQFDDQPTEHFIIFGYSVTHSENEEDGKTQIELTHRNQFQTERKEDQIVFLVQHSESARKWLEALQKVLRIEQTKTENSQE